MTTQFFKRDHMEIDLHEMEIGRAVLPDGYRWRAWSEHLLLQHAQAKYESFRKEKDSSLFPCLGNLSGCVSLMQAIASHPSFVPRATWLIEFIDPERNETIPCGTVQGISSNSTSGAIQNIGIIPGHRREGLGRLLLLKALRGFRAAGLIRVSLDVTADNVAAVELYRSLGFRCISTSRRQVH